MLTQIFFWVFAAVAVFSAMMTVSRRNPVSSALWLIGTFFSLAAVYTLLGAYFIGIIQILVYAGAIMVLFLFVIMLLNLGNDYQPDLRSDVWKAVAGGSALVMLALIARVFGGPMTPPLGREAGPAVLAAQKADLGVVGSIGVPMYTDFTVHLQVTGILLLVAVIGAVVLAKRNV